MGARGGGLGNLSSGAWGFLKARAAAAKGGSGPRTNFRFWFTCQCLCSSCVAVSKLLNLPEVPVYKL